jgi:hypothetical protein
MKCSYYYRINGTLKIAQTQPITIRQMDFVFETESGLAKFLRITTTIAKDEWPQLDRKDSDSKATLHLRNDRMVFIAMEVRGLEAILSLFGLTSIDQDNWEIEYIPENEEERKSLPFTKFSQQTERVDYPLEFRLNDTLLSDAIAAALYVELGNLTFPLSFFRKGMLSMLEGRFIGAYYEFYFVLENLYGNGQFHSKPIIAQFKKTPKLRAAAQRVLHTGSDDFSSETTRREFITRFQNHTVDSLLKYIVKQRGFLHHHSSRMRTNWHPSYEQEFEIDALLLRDIAQRVMLDELFELFGTDRVKADRVTFQKRSGFVPKTGDKL